MAQTYTVWTANTDFRRSTPPLHRPLTRTPEITSRSRYRRCSRIEDMFYRRILPPHLVWCPLAKERRPIST